MMLWVMIIGGVLAGIGVFLLLYPLIAKIVRAFGTLSGKLEDPWYYESDEGKQLLRKRGEQVQTAGVVALGIGLILLFDLFAARGAGIGLFTEAQPQWDSIDAEGRYMASDGNSYTYFVLVKGEDDAVSLCREPCGSLEELRERLSGIPRENTVVVIDDFGVAATVHEVQELLNSLGFRYLMEDV